MTLENILHYLDTTSRVSCPQITCEQAAEIAAMLREQERWLEWTRNSEDRLDALQYAQQQEACGFAWDCGREIAYLECNIDQVQAWMDAYKREKDLNAMLRNCVADLERDKAYRERVDAGLPIVGDTTTWEEATGDSEAVASDFKNSQPKRRCPGCDLCIPQEATGDIDPGVYEGTGKGFEK